MAVAFNVTLNATLAQTEKVSERGKRPGPMIQETAQPAVASVRPETAPASRATATEGWAKDAEVNKPMQVYITHDPRANFL